MIRPLKHTLTNFQNLSRNLGQSSIEGVCVLHKVGPKSGCRWALGYAARVSLVSRTRAWDSAVVGLAAALL